MVHAVEPVISAGPCRRASKLAARCPASEPLGIRARNEQILSIAVYDLCGGTFDVSLSELNSGVLEVRASHRNTQLGDDDFDELFMNQLAEQFLDANEIDPRQDRKALARARQTLNDTDHELERLSATSAALEEAVQDGNAEAQVRLAGELVEIPYELEERVVIQIDRVSTPAAK